MHIALLGDFSGRANGGKLQAGSVGERRAISIDRDNFEEVFSSLGVELHLPVADGPIAFGEFDDLHPDYLYERLPLFSDLRVLKRRLNKPEHFERAAGEIRQWGRYRQEQAQEEKEAAPPPEPGLAMPDNLLDSVLSESADSEYENTAEDSIDRLIKDIVSPHVEKKADPDLPAMLEAVDEAACELMRKVCHASAFQQLEASWRAVYLLVRRLETDSQLKLFLIDVAREELLEDIARCQGELEHSGTYKLLVERNTVPGATPFAVVNADYYIGDDADDMLLASALATIAEAGGSAVTCGGRPTLADCGDISLSADPADWKQPMDEELANQWAALQSRPETAHIALAAPRFLLRLPYGKKTSPIDSFAYEELPRNGEHRYYLWGNSAYLATLLLAESFQQAGWSFHPGQLHTVDDFPLHVFTDEEGDTEIKPCAEVMLTDSGASRLAQAGLLPVRSVKGKPDIMIPLFPALAKDTILAGPWGGGRRT